jgi:hypothetical protein
MKRLRSAYSIFQLLLASTLVLGGPSFGGCDKKAEEKSEKAKKDDDSDKRADKKKKADDDDDKKGDDDKKAEKKKKKADDDDEADKKKKADDDKKDEKKADDDKKADATALASNEQDVKRYPDEKKLEGKTAEKLFWSASNVRKSLEPKADVVATLAKGTLVEQLASRGNNFLVRFDDPKDKTKKLMGWLYKDAFTGETTNPDGSVTKPGIKCAAGLTHFSFEGDDYCAKRCTSDKQCTGGETCSGLDFAMKDGDKVVGRARHCMKEQ